MDIKKLSPKVFQRELLAYLVSLMEQIKRYRQPRLNFWLEIEKLELILDLLGIADRDWSLSARIP